MSAPIGRNSSALHAWSQLPDIGVVPEFQPQDAQFFDAIGSILAQAGQTERFAVTLLHSHFEVQASEFLVEARAPTGEVITSVRTADEVVGIALRAKSWMFNPSPPKSRLEEISVLTWVDQESLLQPPLQESDQFLLHNLAKAFRRHGDAVHRYGMALTWDKPQPGSVWMEGASPDDRLLVQSQIPAEELRDATRTWWVFDDKGRHTITLGCCRQLTSNRGHSGLRHSQGIEGL